MAHADYNCCAICDSKLEYGVERTKEDLCSDCMKGFRDVGLSILDVDELKKWLNEEQPVKIAAILHSLGFCFCHYGNEIDDLVLSRGAGVFEKDKNRQIILNGI